MLKIRLMRIGGKKRPFYRVVVVDERAKRTGGYVELLGVYNPLTEPKEIKVKQERVDHWVKQGAQLSVGYLRMIGKAPQRAPRKPKKEKKEEPKAPTAEVAAQAEAAETVTETKAAEETPTEVAAAPAQEAAETPAVEVEATEAPEVAKEETVDQAEAGVAPETQTPETQAEETKEEKNEGSA